MMHTNVQDTSIRHRAAVLGSPIRHSLSPVLHSAAYAALGLTDWEYSRHDVQEKQLDSFFTHLDSTWAGVSMTMPLKKEALRFADTQDSRVSFLGVANTAVFDWTRKSAQHSSLPHVSLYNTDVDGIKLTFADEFGVVATRESSVHPQSLPHPLPQPQSQSQSFSALVIGSGSTATSAVAALIEMNVSDITICALNTLEAAQMARRMEQYPGAESSVNFAVKPWRAAVEEILAADIIIAAVPAHATDELAQEIQKLPESVRFTEKRMLDVIYDPRPTQLMTQMDARDADVRGGEHMLLRQALAQVAYMTRTPVQNVLEVAFEPMKRALFASL
ncbi:hypothetical protein B9T39_00105 [Alloscardovia macacae]|uniref:Shikimate dehydrogenase substrate binding N-terminal domain-containing protein n=1 Tax=Alloscardovia macacae TaxID=1160091 RepID=A0A1Y2T069_9BIFI|nr:hypothetical protein [Alloscardovia macacae]OTA30151.1 hypothetical protein B9T39_00105 [Alloscardovia macacae]